MRIALIQRNPIVGDVDGNTSLVREAVALAVAQGAELAVVSELMVCGYPPKDLLLRQGFVDACDRAIDLLAKDIDPAVGLLIGHPTSREVPSGQVANAVSLLHGGAVQQTRQKYLLPNYDVFDEQRYFREADDVRPIEFGSLRLGVHICEDAWWGEPQTFYHQEPCHRSDPIANLASQGMDLFVNLSASPFEINKPQRRHDLARRHVLAHQRPFLFVNQVGGNDDLVFDGDSFVMNADGELVVDMASFAPDFAMIDTDDLPAPLDPPHRDREQLLLDALTLGLGDYMRKCGFTDCVLGLSGGIDSALAACIASRAMGAQNVHCLLMPSRHSSDHSLNDARLLAENLGCDHETIPIEQVQAAYEATPVIGDDLARHEAGLADQNLQARIRGAMVMVRSNEHGWMALATGNKSELAVGYCTIYGDMAGGFAVLSDLLKRDVYAVSRQINTEAGREIIPEHILNKAPSAELAPNQVDQDTLPPYPILDGILEGLIEREESVATLSERFDPQTVRWVAQRMDRNEFKRRQMPPGIKLSPRSFGSGRRMPMASRIEYPN